MKKTMVYLVGAGPGTDDLITLRGLNCIRRADCIIYDRLISTRLLEEAPPNCEKIYVGKASGEHSASQQEINALLLNRAKQGGNVVRLKGGDPYVFGRGGEEALCLYEEGIPFQVIPGVSSAIAGPCFAGMPVTHRGLARSVHIITAHTKSGGLSDEDLKRLAPLEGTLVFLMGLSQTAEIAEGLIRFGMNGSMPAAAVSNAGTPEQKTVSSALEGLSEAVQKAGLTSPAVIIVGETVALGEKLNFLEKLPLWNKKILVTSDRKKNGTISRLLEACGARVSSVPMTEIMPMRGNLDAFLPSLGSYNYVVFTSGNTVELFMQELFENGGDARRLGSAKICAVGPSTRKKLMEYGLRADIVPPVHSGEGLLEQLRGQLKKSERVLLPQSMKAKANLEKGLKEICHVDKVIIYDAVLPAVPDGLTAENFDAVVYTSSLAAENFAATADISALKEGKTIAFSMGASTSAALIAQGIEPLESEDSTVEELVETIIRYFTRG